MTDERIKEELKPCPFCGCKASVFEMVGLNTGHCVQCESCCAGIAGFDTEDEAREAWNTRAAERLAKIEALEEVRKVFLSNGSKITTMVKLERMIAELKEEGE